MNVQPFFNEIQNLDPLNQEIFFNRNLWKNNSFLKDQLKSDVAWIIENSEDQISRGDIIKYLNTENADLRVGFLMSMIWGHGAGENGRPDNRGPWKVSKMFEDFAGAERILKNADAALENNDILDAHRSFINMPRCRVNFFSKFLYFLGKSKGMKNYPLIFDARVAGSLARLNSIEPDVNTIFSIQPSQDAESYLKYVNLIHQISGDRNLDADKIELFLFNGW
jgi:hypothetical protein